MLRMPRRLAAILFSCLLLTLSPALAQSGSRSHLASEVFTTWYKLVLELVRHTPTYSPPVASRAFGYLGVTGYEAVASGSDGLVTLAGQLNGLTDVPKRVSGDSYDEAVVLQAAMSHAVATFFSNTGPTGQRAMQAMTAKLDAKVSDGIASDVVERSRAYGKSIAVHIEEWSRTDGGAVVENMGFPYEYQLTEGKAHWVPTNLIRQQQAPLLPKWGENRPFAMPAGTSCPLPPPPVYSEDPTSIFYREAKEVYDTAKSLTDEQKIIARFWSDDPMLSPTPPGHWFSIALIVLADTNADLDRTADTMARLGIAVADAFIGCWQVKFEYDLLRPVTYIKRVIDKNFETLLITPPFPEYPSGHSTQSGAAATVLTAIFGEKLAFVDNTHEADGIKPRPFRNFWQAADEAGISRLYGGIHFRAAIKLGLDQGKCIGAYATRLKTVSP